MGFVGVSSIFAVADFRKTLVVLSNGVAKLGAYLFELLRERVEGFVEPFFGVSES